MNSVSKWKIYFKPQALSDLKNLPYTLQKRIAKKMRFFISSGNPMKFVKNLKDNQLGGYRFRVGDFRIIADIIIEKKEIIILKVGKRDEVYK